MPRIAETLESGEASGSSLRKVMIYDPLPSIHYLSKIEGKDLKAQSSPRDIQTHDRIEQRRGAFRILHGPNGVVCTLEQIGQSG